MSERLEFRLHNLSCRCDSPHPLGDGPLHVLHIHGRLEVRLGATVIDFLSNDLCINDWILHLVHIYDQALENNHHQPAAKNAADGPVAFFISGPEEWPEFEMVRLEDLFRISIWRNGQIAGFCIVPLPELQAEMQRFMTETSAMAESRYVGPRPIPQGGFYATHCHIFTAGMSGQGTPQSWEE